MISHLPRLSAAKGWLFILIGVSTLLTPVAAATEDTEYAYEPYEYPAGDLETSTTTQKALANSKAELVPTTVTAATEDTVYAYEPYEYPADDSETSTTTQDALANSKAELPAFNPFEAIPKQSMGGTTNTSTTTEARPEMQPPIVDDNIDFRVDSNGELQSANLTELLRILHEQHIRYTPTKHSQPDDDRAYINLKLPFVATCILALMVMVLISYVLVKLSFKLYCQPYQSSQTQLNGDTCVGDAKAAEAASAQQEKARMNGYRGPQTTDLSGEDLHSSNGLNNHSIEHNKNDQQITVISL